MVLSAMLLSACTELKLWAVNAPLNLSDAQIQSDIVFDLDNNLKLDIYFPKNIKKELPLIVFFYGGSWQEGKKEDYKFVAAHFVERGYAVAIPNYRKYPEVTFPNFIHDNARAVAWLHHNAHQYNIDVKKTTLMGHSAGAFNGALLTYNNAYLRQEGVDAQNITGFVGLSGPYAFTPEADDIKAVFAPPSNYPAMQIPDFVATGAPPALLLQGSQDKIVGGFNTTRLEKALRDNDVPVTVHRYLDMGHVDTIAALTWVKKGKSTLVEDIDKFLMGDM